MSEPTDRLLLVDPENGTLIELTIASYVLEVFHEQLKRGGEPEDGLMRFRERLETMVEYALVQAIDDEYEPPSRLERAHAVTLAHTQDLRISQEALKSRRQLHQFLKNHRIFPYSEPRSDEDWQPLLGLE